MLVWAVAQATSSSFKWEVISLKRWGLALSEKTWKPSVPLLEFSPRRMELAWAREPLSPEQVLLTWARIGQGCAQVLFSSLFLVMVTWLIVLLYLKHELCEYACIKWFMCWNWWVWYVAYETWLDGWLNMGVRLVCMINLWLVGGAWLWYELDVIPWISWWDLMVVPHVKDVIPRISWWDLIVVPHVMDVIPWTSWWENYGGASAYVIK